MHSPNDGMVLFPTVRDDGRLGRLGVVFCRLGYQKAARISVEPPAGWAWNTHARRNFPHC